MNHIVSWSGGKDSTASVILFKEHFSELITGPDDEVDILFAEVMFDKNNGISGENPRVISFIYNTKEVFESWGFNVHILRSDKDFLDVFYHKIDKKADPLRHGLTYGFPLPGGRCAIKRDCKTKPLDDWRHQHSGDSVSYVGIAIDEPSRLESMREKNQVSLLEKYSFTEDDAYRLCKKYGLLSPQYYMDGGRQRRSGCWMCPHSKLCEHRDIKELLPEAWEKYVSLEDTPNLGFRKWNPYSKETLHDRDYALSRYRQESIFDLI